MWRKTGDPLGSTRKPTEERFWGKVDVRGPDECWPWTASTVTSGYGLFNVGRSAGGNNIVAHRYAYQSAKGPIPDGMTLDHLCHTAVANDCRLGNNCPHRRCCNPAHLEPTSGEDNTRRGGRSVRTHCPRGHEWSEENTHITPQGHRECMVCRREDRPLRGNSNAQKTHCKRGHEFTTENTRMIPVSDRLPNGGRSCRTCEKMHDLERKPRTGLLNPILLNAAKTNCKRGHEFTAENTYTNPQGARVCRTCAREKTARLRADEMSSD